MILVSALTAMLRSEPEGISALDLVARLGKHGFDKKDVVRQIQLGLDRGTLDLGKRFYITLASDPQ